MINPFKKSYKISGTTFKDETFYWVKYGWLWGYEYILEKGDTCGFWSTAELYGGKFKTIDLAEAAIKSHSADLIDQRLSKASTKTIRYV